MNIEVRGFLFRYGAAAAAIAVATGLRLLVDPWLEDRAPFITLLIAILVAAWYGGLGPGLGAMVLGAVAAAHFFILPREAFFPQEQGDWISWGLFGVLGSVTAIAGWRMRGAHDERLRAAEEVRRNEALFRAFFELSSAALILADPATGRLLKFNRKYCEITGYTEEELLNLSFRDLTHPDDRDRDWLNYGRLVRGEVPEYTVEKRYVRKDGGVVWVRVNCVILRSHEGAAVYDIAVAQDITDRIAAEKAVRDRERLYRAIGESIEYGVWVCDPNGRNIYTSESFLNLVGMTQQECSDFGWSKVLHPEDAQRTLDAWKECVRTMGTWDIEHRYLGVDGEYHPVLARGVPVRNDDGRVVCWAGINLDISRLKEAEEALRVADRRKNEFLAMLAHELRNPLAPIRSGLDVLSLQTRGENETVQLMQSQVDHLVRLVDDLLDISRIIRGKIELRRARVDLCAIVRQAVEAVEATLSGREQEIAVSTPAGPVWLSADPVRLVQVVENLLNNASKYSDAHTRIELAVERGDGEAVLRIRDHGIGIEPELLPRVFDLFTQSDKSRERAQGGLGIGLTLVHDLAALHGGSVEARSDGVAQGSEFVVRLPLTSEIEPAPETLTPPPREAPPLATPRRILIVDDNVSAAKTLSLLLTNLGPHRVEVVHDGPAALDKAREMRPEIVLLDIGMPRMNGYEVCQALRQTPAGGDTLLVAVSGYGQAEDRRLSREAGFDDHLVKPLARTHVEAVLAHPKLGRTPRAATAALDEAASRFPDRFPRAPDTLDKLGDVAPQKRLPPIERRTGDFLRELAHEVGNAVYPLQLTLQILEQSEASPAMQGRLRQALESQIPFMNRILQQLRRVSRVIRGAIDPQPRTIDVVPVIHAAANLVRPRIEEHGQHLDVEAPDAPLAAYADSECLEQALVELLQNAISHTGREGRITLSAHRDQARLWLRVRDTGQGIPPELLPHIFEPFVRGVPELDFSAGRLGLGLALVQQIAHKHGGDVAAQSAGPGQGSEFTLRLPLDGDAAAGAPRRDGR